MKYTPRLPRINDNVTPGSPVREFLVLMGGVLGLILGIYIILGLMVDFAVPRISLETEQRIAGYFSRLTDTAEKHSTRVAYLQTLTDQLKARCAPLPYEVKVNVSENQGTNAVALPGGAIIVFSGLLEKMTSENELAFVLSHELGHFHHRDHLRAMGRGLVLMVLAAFLFGSDSSTGDLLSQFIGITELGFSRIQEKRADEFGVSVVSCFYGHMTGSTDFFEKIKQSEDPSRFGRYFTSHPELEERIRHILDYGREKAYSFGCLKPLPEQAEHRIKVSTSIDEPQPTLSKPRN